MNQSATPEMRNILVLVPTPLELESLTARLQPSLQRVGGALHLCGFGPVAAAARTSQLIARHAPDRVLLVGIAGSLTSTLPAGSACTFDEVACYGIGVGTGEEHVSASALGWHQWNGGSSSGEGGAGSIGDVLQLAGDRRPEARRAGRLLTCCAASASPADAQQRKRQHPEATAEDMEGFGVAVACSLAGWKTIWMR